jgi:PAS domain S-box-containing protein
MIEASEAGRLVARRMTAQYLLVLGVLAALTLGGYATFLAVTFGNEGSAAQINIAGRQRMLSQRAAFLAWRLVHAEATLQQADHRRELGETLDLIERSHEALLKGDRNLGLSGRPSAEIRSLYFGPNQYVDRRLKEFVALARKLERAGEDDLRKRHDNPVLLELSARAGDLVHSLDLVARQFQAESESSAVLMGRIGTLGMAATLLVLAVAGGFVFAPMVSRVAREVAELHQAQERYMLAIQGTNEGLWDWDITADRVFLSPRLRGIFDIEETDRLMTGRDWLSVIHPDDRHDYVEALREHLKGRTAFFTCDYRLVRGEGDLRWVRQRGVALRGRDGRAYRMAGSVGDVTERRLNEENLRLAASVFENSPHGIMITDARNEIRDVNPAFTSVTGFTRGEVIGHTPAVLSSGRHGPEFYQRMWADLKERELWAGEIWNRRKSGAIYPEWLEITVLKDAEGTVTHYIGQFNDISRAKEDEERLAESARQMARQNVELERALVKAKEANRAKSEFLAAMSHELRTPLNAVIGFSDAMLARIFGAIGDERYEGYLKNIRDSGQHLLDVINDILDVSRVEAGRIDLIEEPVDVAGVIDASLRLVRERADREGVALVQQVDVGLPALKADPRRIKQVLLNLLANAIKFTNPGGRITLTAWASAEDGIAIRVADTGIGIAKKDLARVLTPFTQVDSELSRKYEGTGLGLPLTKGLVEAHGGRLELHSELGVGTQVTVHFPKERTIGWAARGLDAESG